MTADDLTRDAFLGGQVQVWQPRKGYRAGIDPVFLAAAVPAVPGQAVLELGCGVGVAMMCLARRVSGLALAGVELQTAYASLARRNLAENDLDATVFEADLADLPKELRQRSFDHVMANPPYFRRSQGNASADPGRDAALAGTTPLSLWVDSAARRLGPGGLATFIQRADRLPELLGAMAAHLGSLRLRPIQARSGRTASLVIVHGRKGGRSPFVLDPPIVLHRGPAHLRDGEDYTAVASAILRRGAALAD